MCIGTILQLNRLNGDILFKKGKNIRPWHLLESIGKKDCKSSIDYIESLQLGGYTIIPLLINFYNLFNTMLLYKQNPFLFSKNNL